MKSKRALCIQTMVLELLPSGLQFVLIHVTDQKRKGFDEQTTGTRERRKKKKETKRAL